MNVLRAASVLFLEAYYVVFGGLTMVVGLLLLLGLEDSRGRVLPVALSGEAGAVMVMVGGGLACSIRGRTPPRSRRIGALALIVGGVLAGGLDGALFYGLSGVSLGEAYVDGAIFFGGIAVVSGLLFLV
jgi:hypothetical protein